MIRAIKTVIFILFFITSFSVYGQRAKGESITHEYFRLPIHKTDEALRQYRVEASIPYREDYEAEKVKHEADVKAAEDEYQIALKSKSEQKAGSKIVDKLTKAEPPKRREIPAFETRRDIPSESEIKTKVKLQGFKKVQSGGILISIEVSDYDVSVLEKTSGEGKMKAEVGIRMAAWVKIESTDGEVLYDQTPAAMEIEYKSTTSSMATADFRKYMDGSKYKSWLDGEKRKVRTANMNAFNEELNSQFGYSWVTRTSTIYTGAGKKIDYSDLDAAQLEAKHGLQDMKIDKVKCEEQLHNAVKVWRKVLDSELESGNKKARINNKVGAGLYINCAVAYVYLGELDEANSMLNDVEGNDDFKKGDIREAEQLRKYINDHRSRQ